MAQCSSYQEQHNYCFLWSTIPVSSVQLHYHIHSINVILRCRFDAGRIICCYFGCSRWSIPHQCIAYSSMVTSAGEGCFAHNSCCADQYSFVASATDFALSRTPCLQLRTWCSWSEVIKSCYLECTGCRCFRSANYLSFLSPRCPVFLSETSHC